MLRRDQGGNGQRVLNHGFKNEACDRAHDPALAFSDQLVDPAGPRGAVCPRPNVPGWRPARG